MNVCAQTVCPTLWYWAFKGNLLVNSLFDRPALCESIVQLYLWRSPWPTKEPLFAATLAEIWWLHEQRLTQPTFYPFSSRSYRARNVGYMHRATRFCEGRLVTCASSPRTGRRERALYYSMELAPGVGGHPAASPRGSWWSAQSIIGREPIRRNENGIVAISCSRLFLCENHAPRFSCQTVAQYKRSG